VAVMGPSGSGKSTAMNLLGCLDTPTSGEYLFRASTSSASTATSAHCCAGFLGFVFQGFNLLARTSAQENVELPLLYRGEPADERHAAWRGPRSPRSAWPDGKRTRPAELSGGQQQRVAIARAIVTNPLVLLADEPTGNLDSKRSHEIMDLLTRLNSEQGITIIMVTHEPDMAGYARRIVHFVDGRIASDSRTARPPCS
jgi:putative ABC transport system ATP-binding protein